MENPEQKPEFNKAPTNEQLIAEEQGPGKFPKPPVIDGGLPAGGAGWAVPHYQTKTALLNMMGRSYFWAHDEALKHNRLNAVRMLNDTLIRDALVSRWTPISMLGFHLEPLDATDPGQTDSVEKLTKIILMTPKLQDFFYNLLWAEWYGRAALKLIYTWEVVGDEKWMIVEKHSPVNGDSLVVRWSGDLGQRVMGLYPGDTENGDGLGLCHFFSAVERESLVLHQNYAEDSDYFDPEKSGEIFGSSLRGHVYWPWYLKSNYEALLGEYGEKFVKGVWVGWYDSGDEAAKTNMASTLAGYSKDRSILLPRSENGDSAYGLDIKETGTQNPQFLSELVQKYSDLIVNYLTYRNLNDLDMPVGGDGAGLVEDRISRGIKASAGRLAESLTTEWISVLNRYNCPGNPCPRFKFEIDAVNAGELLGYAQTLANFGYVIPIDDFVELCGLPAAGKNDTVYSKVQPLSPMASQTPDGTPQVTTDPSQQQPSPQQPSPQPAPPPQSAPAPQPTPAQSSPQPNLLA